jgi:hypothetical protein
MSQLTLKCAKVSRPSGHWRDDDYEVICKGAVVGRVFLSPAAPARSAVDVDTEAHAGARLRGDA